MRAGIIAEGRSDLAVIRNVLKGALGIDGSDISYLLPELEYDETDLVQMRIEQFSNWTIVKARCEEGKIVQQFFSSVEDERFLVIHIDTAERLELGFEVIEPQKEDTPNYVSEVRTAVVLKLREWLGENCNERIVFAVTVEEIEAWVIPIFDANVAETGFYRNPKERLRRLLERTQSRKERNQLSQMNKFDEFLNLSDLFRKRKNLEGYTKQNGSLKIFCDDLNRFLNQ